MSGPSFLASDDSNIPTRSISAAPHPHLDPSPPRSILASMNVEWYDIVGTVGVAAIVGSYLLLQTQRLRAEDVRYSVLNATGALLIVVSLIFDFNLSAFIVEAFWVLISLIGIGRWLVSRNRRGQAETAGPD